MFEIEGSTMHATPMPSERPAVRASACSSRRYS